MKLYEFVDECLTRVGVEKIFGIPGALVMPIWQHLTRKEVILCSHEQEASYVATGYAKKKLKPVCVVTTGGPGVTNCVSGIASANIDSVPLIYISGRTPVSKNGKGLRQEESNINRLYDSSGLLCEITKKSVLVDDISTAASVIWDTITIAITNRKGAVHISIPVDIQNMEIDDFTFPMDEFTSKTAEVVGINERPLFVVGWGAWMSDSYSLIYNYAELVNAPILVSSKAYCCIDSSSDMFLGKLGYGYNDVLDMFIRDYSPDSIVSFGSSLGEKDIVPGSILKDYISCVPTYLVADDIDYIIGRDKNIKGICVDDLQAYLTSLLLSTQRKQTNQSLIEEIRVIRDKSLKSWEVKILPDDVMAQCISLINKNINRDCVVFADAGNNLANAGVLIMPEQFGQMFIDVGLRAMGTGICSAVGMAIADKTKCYIAITGDGCMLMNGNVMNLAAELQLPIIFIVFNNHSLGRVRVGQSIMNDYRATDINNVDFVSYAHSFGIDTYYCDSLEKFEIALLSAIRKQRKDGDSVFDGKNGIISLIEVITPKDEVPLSVKGRIY